MSEHESVMTLAEKESTLLDLYRQMNEVGQQLLLVMAHTIAGNPKLHKSAEKQ